MKDRALPLWAETGWDRQSAMFVERLDGAGRPILDAPRRAMVQSRQIFAFSTADKRGWVSGFGDRLMEAADSFIQHFHAADGAPGWIFSVHRSGAPAETRRDLYGHAFVLLALATLAKATGERRFLTLADETLDFLDRAMALDIGGYRDTMPPPADGHLRQNPHMHLFEALLALHDAAPEGDYLPRAEKLVNLLNRRFLKGGVLVEYFDQGWTPRGGPDFPFEPGHHCEWAWLLTRHAALVGRPRPETAAALWRSATTFGIGQDGTIFDETSLVRGPLQRSTRLWPYAEAAKAAGRGLAGETPALSAETLLDALHERFLAPAFPGSWIDHFDAEGRPKTDFAPASSLYHIVCALDDVTASPQPR